MKHLLLLSIALLFAAFVFGQTDTLSYSKQRNKINDMLGKRNAKFSQYDTSLTKRSGIFGLQTKNDIRKSNDILMDIVETDDEIFTELKVLFDYRTTQLNNTAFQKKQIENTAKDIEKSRIAYMNTINNFRKQNEALQADLIAQKADYETKQRWYIGALVFTLTSILVLLFIKRKRKA